MENTWIKISDRLPSENGFKICWCGFEPGLIHYHKDTGWMNGFYNDRVTHWFDLVPPSEPKETPMPDYMPPLKELFAGLDITPKP